MKRRDFIKNMSLTTASAAVPNWLSRTSSKTKPTVLVYGFPIFVDEKNISQETIEKINPDKYKNANIITKIFPTGEESLSKEFQEALEEHKPDFIIGLGEFHSQNKEEADVRIETSSYIPQKGRIDISCDINLEPIKNSYQDLEFDITESHSPGINACGQSLHKSIEYFQNQNKSAQCFFLHLKDNIARLALSFISDQEEDFGSYEDLTSDDLIAYENLASKYHAGLDGVLSKLDKIFNYEQQMQR